MVPVAVTPTTQRHLESQNSVVDTSSLEPELQTPHLHPARSETSRSLANEHRKNLERRLQAQLKDGSRSKDVKRLGDPLVRHLLRVAGNSSYRNVRQSVIVTGKTLICELLSRFPCKRLAGRRQGVASINTYLSRFRSRTDAKYSGLTSTQLDQSTSRLGTQAYRGNEKELSRVSSLNVDIETHYINNRILRKVAGFHSYDDGCVAEMRMPEPASDMGNIRLLLCLGRLARVFGQPRTTEVMPAESAPVSLDSGAVGTLIRTAAALQWQGAWILPSCPDVFNPLAIRASQGALFWLPYRRGTVEELVQFCRAKDLAICVPHTNGIPVSTSGIFEDRKKKGVCLVLDSTLDEVFEGAHAQTVENLKNSRSNSFKLSVQRKNAKKVCMFKPDISLSLGTDVAPERSMQLLHPITIASLLLYHIKQTHFPSLRGSPHIFSGNQRM